MPINELSPCHHCHIHSPIPASELIKSHPLRSAEKRDGRNESKRDISTVAEVHSSDLSGNKSRTIKIDDNITINNENLKNNGEQYDKKSHSSHHHHCHNPRHKHKHHKICEKHTNSSKNSLTWPKRPNFSFPSIKRSKPPYPSQVDGIDTIGVVSTDNIENSKRKTKKSMCLYILNLQWCNNKDILVSSGLLIAGYSLLVRLNIRVYNDYILETF